MNDRITIEDIVEALYEFRKEHYGISPNVIQMHPATWERFRLDMTPSLLVTVDILQDGAPRIYGVAIKLDLHMPIGEVVVALERTVRHRVRQANG